MLLFIIVVTIIVIVIVIIGIILIIIVIIIIIIIIITSFVLQDVQSEAEECGYVGKHETCLTEDLVPTIKVRTFFNMNVVQ